MLIYNPPHGKSIRVPKTFVLFELFVFKERIPSVCQKLRVIFEKFVFKKSSPPKSHTPMLNPGGPLLSYSISVTFPSLMKNEQSYFSIFLPFFITTPACRLPLMAQPEMSYSLPSIAFVVRTDVMPDFMSSGISLFSNISVPFS